MLIDLIVGKYNIISVVGLSKNAGKTVTLNELISQAADELIPLGLTSIGRDGESQDLVTCTEKPMIFAEEGTLIATAEALFNCGDARLEILEVTDHNTAIGKIIIARVIGAGYIQLAGPSTNADVRSVSERMLAHGADLIIVDGALDRMSSASPDISDATLLATGAVLSRDMNKAIERSVHQAKLFDLPAVEALDVAAATRDLMEAKQIGFIHGGFEVQSLTLRTALGAGRKIAAEMREDTQYVILPGSVVTKTIQDILAHTKHYKNTIFIIKDATKIFIEPRNWLFFMKKGIQFQVLEQIKLLAMTVNPYAPQGYYFDPKTFKESLAEKVAPLPVINVMETVELSRGGDHDPIY